MTDNERDVERRITTLESNVNNLVKELLDFKTELRRQNEMRANEIRDLQKRQDEDRRKHDADMREIHEKQDAMQAKHDADMRELQKRQDEDRRRHEADMREMNKKIDSKFDKLSDQFHTMTITAIVGFGAILVAVGGLIMSTLK